MAPSQRSKVEDVYLGVMGITGAGKSTFIKECSRMNVGIGHSLKSFTSQVEDFTFMYNGKRIHLVDTPGFDDTDVKETDILRRIAAWLGEAFDSKIKLSGLIYLHRISDPRMPGSARRSLHMFQRLCGPEFLPHVTLVTTMWNTLANQEDGFRREKELLEIAEFWGWMVRGGSRHARHFGGEQAAMQILDGAIARSRPMILNIQQEMKIDGKDLNETMAGMTLNEELIELENKHKQEIDELEKDKAEALRAKDVKMAAEIAESQRQYQAEVSKIEQQRKKLEVDNAELKRQREQELKDIQRSLKVQAETLQRREAEFNELLKKREEDRVKYEKESELRRKESQDAVNEIVRQREKKEAEDQIRRDREMEEQREELRRVRDDLDEARKSAMRKHRGIGGFLSDLFDEIFG